jgi:hypothetical protein
MNEAVFPPPDMVVSVWQTGGAEGKAIPLQAWTGPEGSRSLRLPDFMRLRLPDFMTIGT